MYQQKSLNPVYGYLTLKPYSKGFIVSYNITEINLNTFAFLYPDIKVFNLLKSYDILVFNNIKEMKYYYETNNVKHPKKK